MPELARMRWDKQGPIARVVLNRPEMLNAMDNQATLDLNVAVDAIAADEEIRVVVITGSGRAFCTGIDLKQLARDEIELVYHTRFERGLRVLEKMDKIVIVGIHSYCLGGGLQLALACDIRVAADDAVLGLPAIKEGLIPGLSTLRLSHYVGMGRAKRLVLSGENIGPAEAYAIGLVDYIVPAADFGSRLEELVQHYLANCCQAMRLCKLLINESFDLDHSLFLKRYMEEQAVAQTSADHLEARRAFREKRAPVWR